MKKIQYLIILLVIFNVIINASGGSLYTRYGVGDAMYNSSTRVLSMGGLGTALQNFDYLSDYNPANWNRINSTRVEASLFVNGLTMKDNANKSTYFKALFNGFKIGMPIERDLGASLVFGLSPESFVQYETVEQKTNTQIDDYTTRYEGKGGLSKIFFGSSLKLPYNFVIGASYDYYFGSIQYNSSLEFLSSSEYEDALVRREKEFRGMGFNVGLLTPDMSPIFNSEKIKDFHLGLTFKYIANLKTDTSLVSGSLLGTKVIQKLPVYTHIPYRFGVGVSFIYDNNYLIIADYLYQPWTKYSFDHKTTDNFQDVHKVSLGIEHRNNMSRFSTFIDQIVLRGGISYEKTQYKFNGTGINQLSLSTGVSLPLSYENSIDVGFLLGFRGTQDNNLIKETIYNLAVSISFGEVWFLRADR